MEPIFTKLVDQFISGKLSRRGLIQSLGAAAAVAGISDRTALAASGRRELNSFAVNHISYQVKDYAKSRDFYAGNFGMKVSNDSGKQCYLNFGETFLIVRNAPAGAPTPSIDHIAYTIRGYGSGGMTRETFKADNESVRAELEGRGLKPEPDTDLSWKVKDPDGFMVQVVPELNKPGNPVFDQIMADQARARAKGK